MPFTVRYFNFLTALIISLLSVIALLFNYFVTKFPGNNYFAEGSLGIFAILFISLTGTYLLFGKESPCWKIMQELVFYYLIICVGVLATNAIQFTPFNPIDRQLIAIDSFLGIQLENIVAWVVSIPKLNTLLVYCYDSLASQMLYLPLLVIFARKFIAIREYYSYLLITTLIGFTIYYFWPTIGPASSINNPIFSQFQYATGVKFSELHKHIQPSTLAGGMIAMPSFHVIWAVLCIKLSRCCRYIFALILPLNVLLIASCVLLGWHYFIDVVGSLIVLLFAHLIYFHCVKKYSRKLELFPGSKFLVETQNS